jgi:hypothetical protein
MTQCQKVTRRIGIDAAVMWLVDGGHYEDLGAMLADDTVGASLFGVPVLDVVGPMMGSLSWPPSRVRKPREARGLVNPDGEWRGRESAARYAAIRVSNSNENA